MWEDLTKNETKKQKNKNSQGKAASSPSALFWHSGKGLFLECLPWHSGKNFFLSFNGVGRVDRQVTCFFAKCRSSPSVALGEEGLCRVLLFTECQDICGTRESLSSPSAILPRVQHSRKILFPECSIFGTQGSQRHSGNFVSPVVSALLLQQLYFESILKYTSDI